MKKTMSALLMLPTLLMADVYPALENENVVKFISDFSEKSTYSKEELIFLFSDVKIKEKVKKSSKKKNQAEFKLYWEDYKKRIVSENRINKGKQFIKDNLGLLQEIEDKYDVEKEVITAIIGIESNYGRNLGAHRAIDAISTMAFENNPRSSFFRKQIESFLNRCEVVPDKCFEYKSSWAGAMGYGQFIPTSIDAYAVDYNNNGNLDVINEKEDAIASVANYLSRHSWKKSDFVAIQVTNSDTRYKEVLSTKLSLNTTVEELRFLNIGDIGNIRGTKEARIFELDSKDDGIILFVGFKNFKAITHYNRSNLYALAVYELSKEFN